MFYKKPPLCFFYTSSVIYVLTCLSCQFYVIFQTYCFSWLFRLSTSSPTPSHRRGLSSFRPGVWRPVMRLMSGHMQPTEFKTKLKTCKKTWYYDTTDQFLWSNLLSIDSMGLSPFLSLLLIKSSRNVTWTIPVKIDERCIIWVNSECCWDPSYWGKESLFV